LHSKKGNVLCAREEVKSFSRVPMSDVPYVTAVENEIREVPIFDGHHATYALEWDWCTQRT
jgi:hypothetical protein